MKAYYKRHLLNFKTPSGTSRGVLTQKETWYLIIEHQGRKGVGECGILRGLSYDDRDGYEQKLEWVCQNISKGAHFLWDELKEWPSIQFGVESAFASLESVNPFILFPSKFTSGDDSISINGLVWMGSKEAMLNQITEKIKSGFSCIKLKIGAINFDHELQLLEYIRAKFDANEIEIRVDANGAFSYNDALDKLNKLAGFQLHSIEQPIAKNQHDSMSVLCKSTSLPIALDEELIGVTDLQGKGHILDRIKPQYIILKPSLVGGFRGSQEWIDAATERNIGWWITSALESNIGLNAIAQWTYTLKNPMPQGLGTGSLYTNNIGSPLEVENGKLHYRSASSWDFTF
ncbi:MAG: o-succinylbenzoate synthase [Flavobacterium sp.]|nr:o-succinylbenzoate synthase [Flavobacterium sp.]